MNDESAATTCAACGFDAVAFEPRSEKVAGAMRWHLAVCSALRNDDGEGEES